MIRPDRKYMDQCEEQKSSKKWHWMALMTQAHSHLSTDKEKLGQNYQWQSIIDNWPFLSIDLAKYTQTHTQLKRNPI